MSRSVLAAPMLGFVAAFGANAVAAGVDDRALSVPEVEQLVVDPATECVLNIDAAFDGSTLYASLALGTSAPTYWSFSLTVFGQAIALVENMQLPAITPTLETDLAIPLPVGLGDVSVMTHLWTEAEGVICAQLATTGAPSDDASIVGGWGRGVYSDLEASTTFYPNGYYIMWEDDPDADNCDGVEIGSYLYDAMSGQLTVTEVLRDDNGDCGLSVDGVIPEPYTVEIADDYMTIYGPDGISALERVRMGNTD